MEIDPDIRLASRLTLGGRWMVALNVAGIAALIAVAGPDGRITRTLREVTFAMDPSPWPARGDPGLHTVALVTIMLAPFGILRMVDLEARGALDHIRMCGRPPRVLLMAFLAGTAWPSIAFAAVLMTVNAVRFGAGAHMLWLAAVFCVLQLELALFALRWFPRFALLPAALLPIPVYWIALRRGWIAGHAIGLDQMITAAMVVAALPFAIRAGSDVVERPPSPSIRMRSLNPGRLAARLLPRAGPPELMRQLRCALIQQGWLFATLAAIFAGLVGLAEYGAANGWSRGPLMGLVIWAMVTPWLVVMFAAVTVGKTARLELDTGSLDLVRLTPQKPEAIAAGWYAGISLPFWMFAFACAVTLASVPEIFATPPRPFSWWRPPLPLLWAALAGPAALAPAIALAEVVHRRPPLSYFVYACAAVASILVFATTPSVVTIDPSDPAIKTMADQAIAGAPTLFGRALSIATAAASVVLLLVVMVGAAAGRVHRSDGPSLTGPAAAAAILALAWSLRVLTPQAYPLVAAASLPLLAPFLAEERAVPSSAWHRVAVAMAGSLLGIAAVALGVGVEPTTALTAAAASALALSAAVFGYELLWRWTFPALGLPLAFMIGMLRRADPPVLLLTAALVAVAAAHTVFRRRAAVAWHR